MRHLLSSPRGGRHRIGAVVLTTASVGLCAAILASSAGAAATSIGLGTAEPFGVLAGAGITNTGPTTITGDIGTFPTTSVSGASTITLTGTNHGGDAVTRTAKDDLTTAYDVAAAQGPAVTVSDDLAGRRLTPGVYGSASALGLSGELTLDAQGDPDAVFVFQAGSTLTTASASRVTLVDGAQACNVFWQVGSSATLGTASVFRGSVLALTSIAATTGATIDGRLLARNGEVTLDSNTITRSRCSTTPSTTPGTVAPTIPGDGPSSGTPTPGDDAGTDDQTPVPGTPSTEGPDGPSGSDGSDGSGGSGDDSGGTGDGDGSSQVDRVPRGSVDTGS